MASGNRIGIGFLGSMGLGATLMYVLDPVQGRRRRAGARDKIYSALRREREFIGKGRRDLGHRLVGSLAGLRSILTSADAPDQVIVGRVRAAIGRAVSHPSAIEARVTDGRVTLTGPVLSHEANDLLRRVGRVAGVCEVDDQLERHATAENVAALQGSGRVPRSGLEREIWPPAWRLMTGGAGVALSGYGARRGGPVGLALTAAGGAMLLRAVTNRPLMDSLGLAGDRRFILMRKTIAVHAPIGEVFRFFTQVENFPQFMEHVREVRVHESDRSRSRWQVRGPGGLPMSWEAEVTQLIPDQLFAWKTLGGSAVQHAGIVHFEECDPQTTRVHVQMSYHPPAGALGHVVAALFDSDPKSCMNADLVRFKSLLEEGRTRAHGHRVNRDELGATTGRPSEQASPGPRTQAPS
jgi:uncharacterized membrane protein